MADGDRNIRMVERLRRLEFPRERFEGVVNTLCKSQEVSSSRDYFKVADLIRYIIPVDVQEICDCFMSASKPSFKVTLPRSFLAVRRVRFPLLYASYRSTIVFHHVHTHFTLSLWGL